MTFHEVSEYCFNWLNSQPHVKEESLTDWLLYNVSKSNLKVFIKHSQGMKKLKTVLIGSGGY